MTDLAGPPAEVTQSILFSAEAEARGVYGNCLQAALASALGLELDAVPHVGAFTWWLPATRLWLRGRQLDWRQADGIPQGRSIVVGPTARGTGDHAGRRGRRGDRLGPSPVKGRAARGEARLRPRAVAGRRAGRLRLLRRLSGRARLSRKPPRT